MARSPSLLDRLSAGWNGLANGFYVGSGTEGAPRGARYGRRSTLFEQERRHINSTISYAGTTLRARCRFLSRENAYVANMKRVWTSYAVGNGWIPSVIHKNPEVVASLHSQFKAWTDSCDLDGLTDLYGIQGMVSDEEFEAGECFVRLVSTPAGLKLQLMQSEQLPYSSIGATGTPSTATIRLGIEFDESGQRAAYHFYQRHPGDLTQQTVAAEMLVRIPAEEILHIFTPLQPGQLRGYPRIAGAIVPMFKLDEYEDALIERAAVAAKYAGFIKKTPPAEETDEPARLPDDRSAPGARQFDLETGVVYELEEYEEWQDSNPPDPGSNYDDFLRRQVAKGCAATGVPYAETSGDLKSANFSSTRVGRQPFKRACERWGNSVLVYQFCRRVWSEWLRLGLLAQTINLPSGEPRQVQLYSVLDWLGPKWEYVNPYQDAQADALLVDHGFKPRSRVVQESGYNAEETDTQIKVDQDRQDKLGLRLATTIPSGPAKAVTPGPTDPADPNAPDGENGDSGDEHPNEPAAPEKDKP